jgi:hypothetical protein
MIKMKINNYRRTKVVWSIENDRKPKVRKIKPIHWNILRIILNHCILNRYNFKLVSRYILEIVRIWPKLWLNLLNLADCDLILYKKLTNILLMSPSKIQSLKFDYENSRIKKLSETVNYNNILHYILHCEKKITKE